MKRKLPVVECNLCGSQQVDNGDPTEILGLTVKRAFYAGYGGGGPVPQDFFACIPCLEGNSLHGPALLSVLISLCRWKSPLDISSTPGRSGRCWSRAWWCRRLR